MKESVIDERVVARLSLRMHRSVVLTNSIRCHYLLQQHIVMSLIGDSFLDFIDVGSATEWVDRGAASVAKEVP